MKKLYLTAVLSMSCLVWSGTSWGRGFGGMHRGGFGGGMHAGGLGGGGIGGAGRLGGGEFGGLGGAGRLGGGEFGGLGGGGLGGGGLGGGGLGGGGLGGGGLGGGGLGGGGLGGGGLGGGGLGGDHFPGRGLGGFDDKGPGKGGLGAGGLGDGGLGNIGSGKRPDRNELGSFLGLPSDGGMNKVSVNHVHVGNTQIGGNQVNNRVGNTRVGNTRVGRNQLGVDSRGLTRYSNQNLRLHGNYVRRNFVGRGFYNANWYRTYPGAWSPRAWSYGNVWTAATWYSLNNWFGYQNAQPVYYDYGNNVTYQNNTVYMSGQDMGTSQQYYQQAESLAATGAKTPTGEAAQWMPLGVFAMVHGDDTKANLILQLGVNKQGIIRGNYTATVTDDTKQVHGSVEKKTQRAAWTIGDNKQNVMETGIYNLTKNEAPILVHFGADKTEKWTLVRLDKDGKEDNQGGSSQNDGAQQK